MIIQDHFDFIEKNTNNFIRFGGRGIMDGLKGKGCKYDYYKIIGFNDVGLVVKQYRSKNNQILPFHNCDQSFNIIDKKQFDKLEIY